MKPPVQYLPFAEEYVLSALGCKGNLSRLGTYFQCFSRGLQQYSFFPGGETQMEGMVHLVQARWRRFGGQGPFQRAAVQFL